MKQPYAPLPLLSLLLGLAPILCGCGSDAGNDAPEPLDGSTSLEASTDGVVSEASEDSKTQDAQSGSESGDDSATPDSANEDAVEPGALVLPDTISIPYVVAGTGGKSVSVSVSNPGQLGVSNIVWQLDGSAHLHVGANPPDAIPAGGTAQLVLTYDGATGEEIASATLSASSPAAAASSVVFAAAGDPGLGAAIWEPVTGAGGFACGQGATIAMPAAPFPDGSASWTDDSVRVYFPEGYRALDAQDVIVHFHGFNTTLQETLDSHQYQQHVCASGANAILVVPQGPVDAPSGDFGKLMHPEGLANLVRQVLVLSYREGLVRRPLLGSVTLTSHSGGYQAVAANLSGQAFPVPEVHLFDSLYGQAGAYEQFVVGGGRMFSNYTSGGGTLDDNLAFQTALAGGGVNTSTDATQRALRDTQAVIAFADATHNGSTRIDGIYGDAVRFGLHHHRHGPRIELRQALAGGGTASVSWLSPKDDDLQGYRVEVSTDSGATWTLGAKVAASASSTTFPLSGSARVRVIPELVGLAASEALPSDSYAMHATASVLVVDGFDRVLGGSFGGLHHDFAAWVGEAAGGVNTISHRAIVEDGFALSAYPTVIWLVGDESTDDQTFSAAEQDAITAYLTGGGRLLVSGSEVGYELDATTAGAAFLSTVFGASLDQDDSGSTAVVGTGPLASLATFGFSGVGAPYQEDYPDSFAVGSGAEALLLYNNGQVAAVGRPGQAILVGFPLELVDAAALPNVMKALLSYLAP